MKIYVGRWDLYPYGICSLYEATEEDIVEEIREEVGSHGKKDKRIGAYTPQEFEAEFNEDLDGSFNTGTYWIKIF